MHATVALACASGILIRGASGAGKSTLAAALIHQGGRLVADDTIHLSALGGRVVATRMGAYAESLEIHGRGIVLPPSERSAVIRLVVDLVAPDAAERMPQADGLVVQILGVSLPRQPIPERSGNAWGLLEAALDSLDPDWKRGLRPA